jgi:glutathione peroxidase
MWQEPGNATSIQQFCSLKYNVTFPMAAKVSVKGRSKAPIYHWLTNQKYNHYKDSKVKWNFQKYLINEQGQLTHIFSSATKPEDEAVIAAIEGR